MVETDHELDFLLSLDGSEFQLISGYVVKIEAQYRGPAELLADFYREVERILTEKGVQ